jgi:hypothetical protein
MLMLMMLMLVVMFGDNDNGHVDGDDVGDVIHIK